MFLLGSIGIAVALAKLLGGRPTRAFEVRLARGHLVLAALAIQIVAFSRAGDALPPRAIHAAHLASYALVLAFVGANRRVRSLAPAFAGAALNALAIATNGGRMPVDPEAAAAAGVRVGAHANVSESAHRLSFLGDVFALPHRLPLANAFSVGDILIAIGVVAFVVSSSLDGHEPLLDRARLLQPLRVAPYRRLVAGKLVSHLGDWLTLAAVVGWTYDRTGSTGGVAAVMLARLAPPIVGGGVATVVLDRLPKGRVLVWLEAARGAIVLAALAGVATGRVVVVLLALACSGALAAVSSAAASAAVPALLPIDQRGAANAALAVAKDVAMAAGAAAAGLALAVVGASAALAVDAGTFVVAAALFAALPRLAAEPPTVRERRGLGARALLRFLVRRRRLAVLVGSFAAATIATGLANATLPRFLAGPHGFGGGGYGFGMAALATGLALGEAVVGLSGAARGGGRWIAAGLVVMAVLFALLAATEHGPTMILILAAIGFVDGTTDVVYDTALQHEVEPARHGAVFGLSSAVTSGTMMAAFAVAPAANAVLPAAAVLVGASVFLLAGGLVAAVGLRHPRPVAADARAAAGTA